MGVAASRLFVQQGPAKKAPVTLDTPIGAHKEHGKQPKFDQASAFGPANQTAEAHWAMSRHETLSFATRAGRQMEDGENTWAGWIRTTAINNSWY